MPKRRKKRYKTGIHVSIKSSKPIKYRSGWEFIVCLALDFDSNVISYEYESIIIPYLSNKSTGKMRKYYPDFIVKYQDGSQQLIEVKRQDKLQDVKVVKKLKAAEEWCKDKNVEFVIWSNEKIKQLEKLNQQNYPAIALLSLKPKKRKKKKKLKSN